MSWHADDVATDVDAPHVFRLADIFIVQCNKSEAANAGCHHGHPMGSPVASMPVLGPLFETKS